MKIDSIETAFVATLGRHGRLEMRSGGKSTLISW